MRRLLYLCLLLPGQCYLADEPGPQFQLPLDCRVGVDCWVVNYLDWDDSEAASDYRCGKLTYDGHRGTDIAIRDMVAVARGVPVVAAADGTVLRARDGEPDSTSDSSRARARETGRECGNGVVLDHGNGWISQYCHMRKGSIEVSPGQTLKAGDAIGKVGTSGVTEFPHLHFRVEHEGEVLDPFTGTSPDGTCGGPVAASLWSPETQQALRYRQGQIFNAGFASGAPDLSRVREGRLRSSRMSCDAPALVAWMEAFGAREGDRFRMTLRSPSGELLVTRDETLERTQVRIFRYGGKRLRAACWPLGEYTAEFEVLDGEDENRVLSQVSATLQMLPVAGEAE